MMRHELWKARRRGLNLGRENVSRALSLMRCLRVRLSWQRRHALLSGTYSPRVRCGLTSGGGMTWQHCSSTAAHDTVLIMYGHDQSLFNAEYTASRLACDRSRRVNKTSCFRSWILELVVIFHTTALLVMSIFRTTSLTTITLTLSRILSHIV